MLLADMLSEKDAIKLYNLQLCESECFIISPRIWLTHQGVFVGAFTWLLELFNYFGAPWKCMSCTVRLLLIINLPSVLSCCSAYLQNMIMNFLPAPHSSLSLCCLLTHIIFVRNFHCRCISVIHFMTVEWMKGMIMKIFPPLS